MIEPMRLLLARRELIKFFVIADLKRIYNNKILGFIWIILDPLMMMLVYTFLVVIIFHRGGPQFPVLLFSALLSWRWFTYSVTTSVKSITSRAKLIQTVKFPNVVLPLSRTFIGMINYLFGLLALIPLLFIFDVKLTINIFWLPILIFLQLFFTISVSIFFAAIGVYFRDLENILSFTLRLWFYLSPALYSVTDTIPNKYLNIYMLNPFAILFESYKNVLVRGIPPSIIYIYIFILFTIPLFLFSWHFFHKREPYFAKSL